MEIKCARLGASTPSFQHELGEVPWHPEYMAFIDIAPDNFFLTIFPNLTEEQYKSKINTHTFQHVLYAGESRRVLLNSIQQNN